ncbi:uncharacterized protein J3R85_009442 [Psidium guajava]|nr:uncharacterized protein J3R85_009442 [Psidium guajava]
MAKRELAIVKKGQEALEWILSSTNRINSRSGFCLSRSDRGGIRGEHQVPVDPRREADRAHVQEDREAGQLRRRPVRLPGEEERIRTLRASRPRTSSYGPLAARSWSTTCPPGRSGSTSHQRPRRHLYPVEAFASRD